MKKSYIALPLLAAVLLASCGGNEEQTFASTSTSGGTFAETTQAQTVILSMTEEKQESPLAETAKITTEAPKSEEKPEAVSAESITTAKVTAAAPKSEEKTTDKASGTTAPPKTTEKTTDDGVEVVAEEEAQETREEQEEQAEQEEQEQPQSSEETKISAATQNEELPPITLASTPAATSAPPSGRPGNPVVSWSESVTTTAPATEKSEDKPIELPFVPAL